MSSHPHSQRPAQSNTALADPTSRGAEPRDRTASAHLQPAVKRTVQPILSKPERDQLVLDNLPLASHIAARFRGRGPSFDDLAQVAATALVGAARRYDPARGCDFTSFAIPTMTGEIKRYFRDHTWAVRVPRRLQELHLRLRDAAAVLTQESQRTPTPTELSDYLGVSIEDVRNGLEVGALYSALPLDAPRPGCPDAAGVDLAGSGYDAFTTVDWHEALAPALAELSPRDRQIVYLRFFQELTQQKIADRVGLSQMQVSRVLRNVLRRLRLKLTDDPPAA